MPCAKDQNSAALPAKTTRQLATSTCREGAGILLVINDILISVPKFLKQEKGAGLSDKCSTRQIDGKNSQRKKHQEDTKPDKATTALVKDAEKLGCFPGKQNFYVKPTDGSTDVRRSTLKNSSKKSSRNHLAIRFCRSAEKLNQIRERTGPSLPTLQGASRNDRNPKRLLSVYEERDPNWTDWCEEKQEKRHGHVPKNFAQFMERTQRTRIPFSQQNWDLEQPLDQVLIPKRERGFAVVSGASMHMMSKVDLALAEQESITVSNKPTTAIAVNGSKRTIEQATVYVKDLDMLVIVQLLKDILQPHYILRRTWVFARMERRLITKLIFKNAKTIPCTSETFVPIDAPGVTKDVVSSGSADGSAETRRRSASDDRVRQTASGNRLRDMPEWPEDLADRLVDRGSKSSGSDREHPPETCLLKPLPSNKQGGNHHLFTHFATIFGYSMAPELPL